MTLDVGVVIVTHNSGPVIDDLLRSLPAALATLTSTVVVVDNGSVDDSVRIVREHRSCHVVRTHNRGYAGGVNLGVRTLPEVRSILVLNADVRLAPACVETMFATLCSTGAGVVAPRVLQTDGDLFRSLRRTPTLLRSVGLAWTHRPVFDEHVSDPSRYESRHVAAWALGAVLLIRSDVDAALGGWDESYFLYSEETDLLLRAADRGWTTVYEPRAVATHIGGASGRTARTHTMQVLNRVRLYARRHSAGPSAAYYGLTLLAEVSRLLRGRTESRTAIVAMLRPGTRPAELGCSETLIPR